MPVQQQNEYYTCTGHFRIYHFTIFISCNLKNSSLEIRLLNILLLLLLSPLLSIGQVKNIQGRVLDRQSDEPVPFASVQFSLHRGRVLTDSSGMFIISLNNVLADDSLTITSVGYSPVKIPLSDLKDSSFITVPLKIEASKKEVVVKTSYNRALVGL